MRIDPARQRRGRRADFQPILSEEPMKKLTQNAGLIVSEFFDALADALTRGGWRNFARYVGWRVSHLAGDLSA